ncbi:LytTR family DNA-binding domain-containing protein [Flavobacteriaceae bacterium 3-367]|uniref:LytR/AlgR family response regulator transcription factor n=1 Tax=Eudoraea algarum TaxID=3417568 RepID=UPI0032861A87
MKLIKDFYLFNSRIATHIIFWIAYYIFFGLLWVTDEGYLASFYLEFVLLPTRIMAVYLVIYFLLPRFLLKSKYPHFFLGYVLVLLLAGALQRIFIHLFYENLLLNTAGHGLFSATMFIRAVVLINTTVLLVLGAKLFQLWQIAHEKNKGIDQKFLEIRSNRRMHRVPLDSILFVEGLGNYVVYRLSDKSKITAYGTIKEALRLLPSNFVRVHRSYIVNRDHIKSYDANTIDVQNESVPRGKSVTDEVLLN